MIARVHGIATAAGCQLVAACDLAVCSDDSRFATSGVKYGLFCSTPMVALSRNLARKPAMEMLLTGDFIDAEEARRRGSSTRSCAPDALDDAVAVLCARLLDKPPAVLALGKRAFYRQLELGIEEAYALTTDVIVDNALGPDFAEGLEAFVAKRKPQWPHRPAEAPCPVFSSLCRCSSTVEHPPCKREVGGSSPTRRHHKKRKGKQSG